MQISYRVRISELGLVTIGTIKKGTRTVKEHARHALMHGFGLGGWIPRCLDADARILPDGQGFSGDSYWMAQALLAAMEGNGPSHPNPCVGAVLVKDGRLLARAATQSYGFLHAERALLQMVGPDEARGAVCYTTLEPCAHTGKQPPCTEALIAAGIARCVVGADDPFPAVAGRGLAQLRAAGIEVQTGCLEKECRAWHFPFLASLTLKGQRPVMIGKWAQTLDGHLADDHGLSQWISGPRSRAYAHWLRQKYDAILVGIGTVFADVPSLTVRQSALPRLRHPHKCIYDPFARLGQATPEILHALRSELKSEGPCLFWLVQKKNWREPSWWKEWSSFAVPVFLEEGSGWPQQLEALAAAYLQRLARPLQSVMVEGGTQLLTQLMRADLLDAWQVFLRAAILGGQAHRIGRLPVREGEDPLLINPFQALQDKLDFTLLASYQLDQDIVLECTHPRFAV